MKRKQKRIEQGLPASSDDDEEMDFEGEDFHERSKGTKTNSKQAKSANLTKRRLEETDLPLDMAPLLQEACEKLEE